MLGLLLVVVSVEACELYPSHLEINIRCHDPFTTMVLPADEPIVLIVLIYCSVILK